MDAYAFVTLPENTIATAVGFLWSSTELTPTFPSVTTYTRIESVIAGEITENISELESETHYYIRAYVEHSMGNSYGDVFSASSQIL